MIEINLLPPALRQSTQPTAKRPPVLVTVPKAFPLGMAGVAALMAMLIVVSSFKAGASAHKNQQTASELKRVSGQAKEAARVSERLPTLVSQYTVLAPRLEGKVPWAEILRAVSLRCPPEVQITALELQHDRRTGEPRELTIRGVYSGTASLDLQFANNLKASAVFARVFELVIPEKNLEPDDRTSFALSCLLRPFNDELSAEEEAVSQ